MTVRRRLAGLLAVAAVIGLTACAPALPESVVPGSTVTAGWTGVFTSANAAATPTPGNLDIAAATRAGFGAVVDGEFVPDPGFGAATVVSDDPFTVRYDLAEPAWSDGIPLDAADLMLGWAASSGILDPAAERDAPEVPRVDEFARAIEVTSPEPVDDWQQRVAVAVPAHVVARRALGLDDPMEGKQAVITAIRDGDARALAEIAEVWKQGFTLPESGDVPADLLLSSGPFRVDAVTSDGDGQSVVLVPNAAYRGVVSPQVARVELVPAGEEPLADLGSRLDVVQVAPVAAFSEAVEALERKDFTVETTGDGTVWAVELRPAGVFAGQPARAAFLRALSAPAMIERGGGPWASAYAGTSSMLAVPGSRGYDIAVEDSGFAAALGGADDPMLERQTAGVAFGTPVCVLYDRGSAFAAGAFAALRDSAAEAGWSAVDCGADDLTSALSQATWDAVIVRVPVPQTAAQVAAQWGAGGEESLTGQSDPARDELIARFARTTDVYAARDLRAQIEATIVRAAIALPIAVNPVLTVVDRDVTGVTARSGAGASLTSGVVQWAVVR